MSSAKAELPGRGRLFPCGPDRSALRVVTGVAAIAAGFLLLLQGAALQGPVPNILVGVLGFAVMIVGAHLAIRHT